MKIPKTTLITIQIINQEPGNPERKGFFMIKWKWFAFEILTTTPLLNNLLTDWAKITKNRFVIFTDILSISTEYCCMLTLKKKMYTEPSCFKVYHLYATWFEMRLQNCHTTLIKVFTKSRMQELTIWVFQYFLSLNVPQINVYKVFWNYVSPSKLMWGCP